MALFSYNNYPHLWFPLGRPGGQGGNISLCLKTQRRTIQEHHRHFIRLIETKRQICQISLCSYIFSLFASSISTTPVSAITSKQALRVKFAIEFYKSKITPDFYRLSKCPVRCLIYLCIRKSSIQKQAIWFKAMVREIYLVAKQETGRLVVIGRKGKNNVISEEIVKRETEQLLSDFLYLFYLKRKERHQHLTSITRGCPYIT